MDAASLSEMYRGLFRLFVGTVALLLLCSATIFVPSTAWAKKERFSSSQAHPVGADGRPLPWRKVPAHSILLKELNSGRVLYEHESGKRLSPASLTKIMSALVILE
ncbi:MAG TPA: hypothetical protein VKB81_05960, partial [Nitrospira sp.]|nr:hypothetical protein [Nitrospira sp.]